MVEELMSIRKKTYELQNDVREIFKKIRSDYPEIYIRKKGVRSPYTYRKYSTAYLNFDFNICSFYIKFREGMQVTFSPEGYRKVWAFRKEDFE